MALLEQHAPPPPPPPREDGLCRSSSAIQTWLGPSSLLEEWSKTPNVFVVSFVLSATPQTGETAKVYRLDR